MVRVRVRVRVRVILGYDVINDICTDVYTKLQIVKAQQVKAILKLSSETNSA